MSLRIEGLALRRGSFRLAVDRLAIPPGTIACLMGKSGSGKSTLVDAIAGFLPLDEGTIRCGDVAVEKLPPERRRIAVLFQRSALFPHLSVAENLAFALRLRGVSRAERRKVADRWLERLDLAGLGDRRPTEISGGQAQRTALGRALAAGFPSLLLDEPFTGLDDETRARSRELLRRLVTEEKVSALLVTHDRRDATAIGDALHEIDDGRLTS